MPEEAQPQPGKGNAVGDSGDSQPHDAGLQLVLSQLRSMREEVAVAREADRRETQKALDALAERMEAPVLSSDDEQVIRACVR